MVNTLLVLKLKDADPHSTSKGMQLLSSLDIAVETVLVLVLYVKAVWVLSNVVHCCTSCSVGVV